MKTLHRPLILAVLLALPLTAPGATTDLSSTPLSGASSAEIKPNIMFIMDDSWSMDWDYLPDWADVSEDDYPYQRFNRDFNGLAYNPATRYDPPSFFTSGGALDTTTYKSQTAANTAAWSAVKMDGYEVQQPGTSTANLAAIGAFYYTTVPGEYCTDITMKNCAEMNAPDATHPIAAKLRWCKTAANAAAATPPAGACQAIRIDGTGGSLVTYLYPRIPAPRVATLNVTSSGAVNSITVDAREILSAPVATATAAAIASSINACTYKISGACTTVGYRAVASGTSVIVSAPGVPATAMPSVTPAGVLTVYAFAKPASNLAPGENLLTVITPSIASYDKADGRSDCAGADCSYNDEMTNYANWWAYYRTRMQAMKTAVSRAFEPIEDQYRIGYFTINNNYAKPGVTAPSGLTYPDYQDVDTFSGSHKYEWYRKLFAAKPVNGANTPLRLALANAGRLYANKLISLNGSPVTDPVQYYCQPNVTILSTDGYWNEDAGVTVDGSAIGDRDGTGKYEDDANTMPVVRPQLDEGAGILLKSTRTIYKTYTPTLATWLRKMTEKWVVDITKMQRADKNVAQYKSSTLQKKTREIQVRTFPLQYKTRADWTGGYYVRTESQPIQKTATLYQQTGKAYIRTGQLQISTQTVTMKKESYLVRETGTRQANISQLQQRIIQPLQRDKAGGVWGEWYAVDQCSTVTGYTDCKTADAPGAEEGWLDATTCTISGQSPITTGEGTDSVSTTYFKKVECRWKTTGYQNTSSCMPESSAGYTKTCQTINLVADYPSSCTPSEATGVKCSYRDWNYSPWNHSPTWEEDDSCVPQQPTTATSFDVQTVRMCENTGWTPYTNATGACVTNATTRCQYVWTVAENTNYPNCPGQAAANNTNVTAVECYDSWTSTTAVTSCTIQSVGANRTNCYYSAWSSSWSNVASCTPQAMSTGSVDGTVYVGPARQCDVTWSGWTWVTDGTPPTGTYETAWSAWNDRPSASPQCTPSTASDADTVGTQCRYRTSGTGVGWTNVATCPAGAVWSEAVPSTASLVPDGTNPYSPIVQCRYQPANEVNWANASSCDPSQIDTVCRYTAWSNVTAGACPSPARLPDGVTPGADLPATSGPFNVGVVYDCEAGWSSPVDDPDCLTKYNANPDIVRCSNYVSSEDVTDANYPGFDPDNPPNEAGKFFFHKVVVTNWTPASASVPNATQANPSPTSSITSCEPGYSNGIQTSCESYIPGPSSPFRVDACVPEEASNANNGVITTCSGLEWSAWADATNTGCTEKLVGTSPDYLATKCRTGLGTPTPDTLADVAEYYYITDLRDSTKWNNCTSSSSGEDVCPNTNLLHGQNMSTYTLGLGVSGVMQYQADYKTWAPDPDDPLAIPFDYYSVATEGVITDTTRGICSWQERGQCNWPKPISNEQTTVDDLWHAAVNGRGTYFSADNPSDVAAGISSALQQVTEKEGALTGVTMVSSDLTAADAGYFQVSFTSGSWTGELEKINLTRNGDVYDTTTVWSARSQLNSRAYTSRTIYYYESSAPNNLRTFNWTNIQSDGLDAYFKKPNIATLSQMCTPGSGTTCLSTAAQNAAQGQALVNFLRGDHSNEGPASDITKYFHERSGVLGDIVNSQTVYVSTSPWNYADPGYLDFKAANDTRNGMVYVGANDGMLHAFDAGTGQESWAYVPRFLMKDLFHLADKNYNNNHRYYVDGTPVMGDICTANCKPDDSGTPVWKTILVGGANLGGRGYYALDVTNPASPKALWEFSADTPGTITDANLGYTYGNPVITKLGGSGTDAGKWVVLFTSGYNNVAPGDGKGRLYVVDASDGTLIRSIVTNAGSAASPSGLSKISAWANYPAFNNTALRAYGGDLLGNVWRFDINDTITPSGYEAQRLATLKDSGGNAQPITARPELSIIKNQAVVFIGTGQLLGASDLSTTGYQTFYAIKDRLEAGTLADYGDPRAATNDFVQQFMTTGFTCPAENPYCETGSPMVKMTKNPVDWATDDGWYVDFPEAGERVNVDFSLVNGVLVIGTNRPQSGACVPAGVSYRYFLDYATGGYVLENTDGFGGFELGDYLSSAPSVGVDGDGELWWFSQGDGAGVDQGIIPPNDMAGKARRVSWRELIVE